MTAVALVSRPHTVIAIDIETLLQQVVAEDQGLSWRRDGERELAFDRGLTVKPRKRPHVGWIEAAASAGATLKIPPGRGAVMARTQGDPDVAAVNAALDRLDAWTRSIITANARAKRRPDWMEGVEPKLVEKKTWSRKARRKGKRRGRRKDQPVIVQRWEPCDPRAICATREIYSRWHAGVTRMMGMLEGELWRYKINGFAAPATPWETALQKSA